MPDEFDYLDSLAAQNSESEAKPDPVLEKLTAIEQRQAELERFTKAQAQPQQQQEQQYTNEQIAQWAKDNPVGYAAWVSQNAEARANQAANYAVAQNHIDFLTHQYKEKNPHLALFEPEIKARANELALQASREGKTGSVNQYIETAIKEYQDKVQRASTGARSATDARLGALKFDSANSPSSSGEQQGVLTMAKLEAAKSDPKAFAQLEKQYFESKGILNY